MLLYNNLGCIIDDFKIISTSPHYKRIAVQFKVLF